MFKQKNRKEFRRKTSGKMNTLKLGVSKMAMKAQRHALPDSQPVLLDAGRGLAGTIF